MSARVDLTAVLIPEETTQYIAFAPTDEAGEDIDSGDIDTLTLTLYDRRTRGIINGRDEDDILSEWQDSVDEDGLGRIELTPDDNVIVGSRQVEVHHAMIVWTWGEGRTGRTEIAIAVANFALVPGE